ncbi:MAG TPA: SBBP repeat-containing protein [Flavipsychrobacter sp.]|nr:SBBP repeat-containing protein [Flavipsychrobacter sp.]
MKLTSAFIAKLLVLCLTLLSSFLRMSAQGFAWAQEISSLVHPGNRSVTGCVTDDNNNSYFVGAFSGTTDLDPGPGVMNVTAVGQYDMFILKEDATGSLIWMKHIVAMTANTGSCGGKIGVDNDGNIYVAGRFNEDFDFDPGPAVFSLSSYGGNHSFVLKLDPFGDFIWVKDMGNQTAIANMSMMCMEMDREANIFFACSIGGTATPMTIDVDPGPNVYNILCPANTGNDILIEKLDSAGNFMWAKQISGNNDKDPHGLAVDTLSNVYVTGQFRATADFDPDAGISNLTSTASYDAFIAKYDSAGNYQWAKQISSGFNEAGNDIATDVFGNVVVTGFFDAGTVDFDPGPGVYSITAADRDMFVLKLRSDGGFAWANSVHPGGNDRGLRIATDGHGNVYTTGDFFGGADFDPGPGEYWLSAGVYIQKLDSAGNFAWARAFPADVPADITVDQTNDVYLVGSYTSGGDFDPGPGVFTLSGNDGGFIEKLCGTSLAISADDSTLCVGDQAQLTTPAITGATYTWTMDGTVIAGSSNTITVSTPGVYEVYVTGGCPNASGPLYVYDCLGVGETMKADRIVIYPNPFDDVIAVKELELNDHIYLIDVTGRAVHSWQGTKGNTFTTGDLTPGYYLLRIVNENGAVRANVPVVKR